MPVLFAIGAFIAALLICRLIRVRTQLWIPGWTGGLSLLALFIVSMIAALFIGAPPWFEILFFTVVGAHIGVYMALARMQMAGAWWQFWR